MNYRILGRTDLKISELGFGCGNVGGILVRGDHRNMVNVVARAIELGINYFDTAPYYGDGKSETNLGAILKELGSDVLVGTKIRLKAAEMDRIEDAVVASVNDSLKRLQRESVDLMQLHNPVSAHRQPDRLWVGVDDVEPAVNAFRSLRNEGKIRHFGFTGLGETGALQQVVESGTFDSIQTCYNLLNPSSGIQAPSDFPFQDYRMLMHRALGHRMGIIAIRILAAGSLSGVMDRHPIAIPSVAPISSGPEYADDVETAKAFRFLMEEEITENLVEAAVRFVLSNDAVSTALIGISNQEQLEQAVKYANKGSLPEEILPRLSKVWSGFALERE